MSLAEALADPSEECKEVVMVKVPGWGVTYESSHSTAVHPQQIPEEHEAAQSSADSKRTSTDYAVQNTAWHAKATEGEGKVERRQSSAMSYNM